MRAVHDGAFFLCELTALAALGIRGWRAGRGWRRWALVVAAPLAMAVAWGFLAAPTSTTRLADPALAVFQLAVFGVAALVWWWAGGGRWAAAYGAIALVVVTADRLLA